MGDGTLEDVAGLGEVYVGDITALDLDLQGLVLPAPGVMEEGH